MCEDNEVTNLFSIYYESIASTQFDEAFLCNHTLQVYPTQPISLQQWKKKTKHLTGFHQQIFPVFTAAYMKVDLDPQGQKS